MKNKGKLAGSNFLTIAVLIRSYPHIYTRYTNYGFRHYMHVFTIQCRRCCINSLVGNYVHHGSYSNEISGVIMKLLSCYGVYNNALT